MRIVLAPDSFKGSLDAPAVCAAVARGLQRVWPNAEVLAKPIADGGEGTLDAVLAAVGARGERLHERVTGAAGDALDAPWGRLERDGRRTAVIEIAAVVGITDAPGMRVNVGQRSTRGSRRRRSRSCRM